MGVIAPPISFLANFLADFKELGLLWAYPFMVVIPKETQAFRLADCIETLKLYF